MKVFIYDRTEIKQNLRNEHKREREQFDPMKLKSSCIFLQGDRSIAVPIAEWKETLALKRQMVGVSKTCFLGESIRNIKKKFIMPSFKVTY